MACSDDNLPPKDPLEDEKSKVMYNITRMRKLFPKKCSQYLSKQLKMEHHILETTKIVLDASENIPEYSEESNEADTEMDTDELKETMDKLLTAFADEGKKLDNILKVLEQMKTEKQYNGQLTNISVNEERM